MRISRRDPEHPQESQEFRAISASSKSREEGGGIEAEGETKRKNVEKQTRRDFGDFKIRTASMTKDRMSKSMRAESAISITPNEQDPDTVSPSTVAMKSATFV